MDRLGKIVGFLTDGQFVTVFLINCVSMVWLMVMCTHFTTIKCILVTSTSFW